MGAVTQLPTALAGEVVPTLQFVRRNQIGVLCQPQAAVSSLMMRVSPFTRIEMPNPLSVSMYPCLKLCISPLSPFSLRLVPLCRIL